MKEHKNRLTGVLVISSFPPRECGIATFSSDLVKALNDKFNDSFHLMLCPLESAEEHHTYPVLPDYTLDVSNENAFSGLASQINRDPEIKIILLQHEFGFFFNYEQKLITLLREVNKEVIISFHTVLPRPDHTLRSHVREISDAARYIIVMTRLSADILVNDYWISRDKLIVIAHGIHLLPSVDKQALREKYNLEEKRILSTFGLLGPGKSIETTLLALPEIVKKNSDILFLIIGKTHPAVMKKEGENYREGLKALVTEMHLENHVRFINQYLPLDELLEYLQLTEVYLFTSKDRNQAVSGTFSYAVGCGCPVISTSIPHAREVLNEDTGRIIDFEAPDQLAEAVNTLLGNKELLELLSLNALHKMASTAWQNSALAHAQLFSGVSRNQIGLNYTLPDINLGHVLKMTTDFGMIQFAITDKPDPASGYTLDDNARAMIALCQHFELYRQKENLKLIAVYLDFIGFCLQPGGKLLNYVDTGKNFTEQNYQTNLEDSNGRAAWALGYLISLKEILPEEFSKKAETILGNMLPRLMEMYSTRAMAFTLKGLCFSGSPDEHIKELADRLVQMYHHEAGDSWQWFESYLTYGNSVIPEALLFAWQKTGTPVYKEIALKSFDFLISTTFAGDIIKVISNKGWWKKGMMSTQVAGGEQPIDVSYTIIALDRFYQALKKESYHQRMYNAFNWFLGKNHINQIIYNPSTGGCYDGLEQSNVNLNQGAESTVSYLMARLVLEKRLRGSV